MRRADPGRRAGPGGLTVALSERGIPALAIDITPYAVALARSSGALALQRDVFGHLPGTGRWETVLLADGNIGIGGDPAALLRRVRDLLAPHGAVVAEAARPAWRTRCEQVRLRNADGSGPWFPWAWVGADQLGALAATAGLRAAESWDCAGRWFARLSRADAASRLRLPRFRGLCRCPSRALASGYTILSSVSMSQARPGSNRHGVVPAEGVEPPSLV